MSHLTLILTVEPRQTGDTISRVSELIGRTEAVISGSAWGELPIIWNAPSVVMAGVSGEASTLRDWISRRPADRFIPMGLTGAPREMVTRDEWVADLSWGVKNIWGTGSVDLGFHPPAVVLVSRRSSPPHGSTFGTGVTAEPPVAFHARSGDSDVLACNREDGFRALPAVSLEMLSGEGRRFVSRRLSKSLRRGTRAALEPPACAVIIRPGDGVSLEDLPVALEALLEVSAREALPIGSMIDPSGWSPARDVQPAGPLPAPNPIAQARAAGVRKSRMTRSERRSVLENLVWPSFRPRAAVARRETRDFVASMMGEVVLSGPSFDVEFVAGRLVGISDGAGINAEWEPVTAFVEGALDGPLELTTAGCFSYESGLTRGLRVVERLLQMDHSRGSGLAAESVTDYSFVADIPVLFCRSAFAATTDGFSDRIELSRGTGSLAKGIGVECSGLVDEDIAGEVQPAKSVIGHKFRFAGDGIDLHLGLYSSRGRRIVGLLNLPAESGETGVPGIRFKPLASAANRYELQYVAAIAVGPASSQTLDEHLSSRTKALVRRELANGPRSDEISLN